MKSVNKNINRNENYPASAAIAAIAGWLVPGGGFLITRQYAKAAVLFCSISAIFLTGIYVGSIAVIDIVYAKPWFIGQILYSPAVGFIAKAVQSSGLQAHGRPAEIGQIYTTVAGMMNLLAIIRASSTAYKTKI
ncbi:hypothetical protein SMSP2_01052 [Limihaloglobus sulfuriphilus]|uniref:DUF6677 domain-containing protein n=1 Tax=Limihaloglobus sulfuriphilus TaxID=1851148 RepID=A0A1Q2MDI0_9BACT|nr:DUF6677 family protein [Limihaloglobus sulfuriphilus]AQQ70694.1 hypothetical protein SMSP2_01052 [Limihaloglobus sulfuriphilus]